MEITAQRLNTDKNMDIIKKTGHNLGRETTTGEDFRQGPTPEHPYLLQSSQFNQVRRGPKTHGECRYRKLYGSSAAGYRIISHFMQ